MRYRHLLLILCFLPVLAIGQSKLLLDFGEAGDRDVWIADRPLVPAATIKATEATLSIPLPSADAKSRLYVWDHKTGNLASKGLPDLKGTWKLSPTDYTLVGKVTIRVEHKGAPVAVAYLKVKDGSGERESQIDPSKKGEATFFGVKPGTIDVTVRYNVDGQDASPVKQSFSLDAQRSQADPTLVVSLTESVETVTPKNEGAAAKGEEGKTEPKSTAAGGNVFGNILVYLIALLAGGAAIFFGMRYMRENKDKVEGQLKKLGVQIPEPADPAQADPAPAPVPTPPTPPQKIILDDADPNVPVTAAAIPMTPPSVSVGQPSLVMENGDVFPIPEGEITVGREATNGLSLISETTVSRRHAAINRVGNEVRVRDEGSSNGTFVNGVKIASDTVLRPGDQVQFGQARFRYEA